MVFFQHGNATVTSFVLLLLHVKEVLYLNSFIVNMRRKRTDENTSVYNVLQQVFSVSKDILLIDLYLWL